MLVAGGTLALVALLRSAPEARVGRSAEPSGPRAELPEPSSVSTRTPLLATAGNGAWSVSGTLTDERGLPLQRALARIALRDEQGTTHAGLARDDGSFAFLGLHAGRWRIACDGTDVRGDTVDFELTPERPRAEVDLVVERGRRIDVRLLATDGRALSSVLTEHGACATDLPAIVVLDPSRLFESLPDATGDGVSAAPGPSTGQVLVPAERTVDLGALAGDAFLARVRVFAGDATAELRIDSAELLASLATVVFVVVDEDGAPLPGASARGAPRGALPCAIPLRPDGSAEWRCLPGEVSLLLRSSGCASWSTRLRIAPGVLDLGRVTLERARSVRGTVLDRDGRPFSVALRCEREEAPGRWTALWTAERLHSGVDGGFAIVELGRGRHRVLAEVSGSEPTEFDVSDEVAAELVVVAGSR